MRFICKGADGLIQRGSLGSCTLGMEQGFQRYRWRQGCEGKLVSTCDSVPAVTNIFG